MVGSRMVKLIGNTYPVRDRIRALGGRWNARDNCWMVPSVSYAEAARLLPPAEAPHTANGSTSGRRAPRTCKDCGCRINYGVYCGKCEYH